MCVCVSVCLLMCVCVSSVCVSVPANVCVTASEFFVWVSVCMQVYECVGGYVQLF